MALARAHKSLVKCEDRGGNPLIVVFIINRFVLTDEMVISSSKYEVMNTVISSFESRMALTVRRLTEEDIGGYRCVAKNSLGETDSLIRIYGQFSFLMSLGLYLTVLVNYEHDSDIWFYLFP